MGAGDGVGENAIPISVGHLRTDDAGAIGRATGWHIHCYRGVGRLASNGGSRGHGRRQAA